MAIRTNSKKACENIRAYILDDSDYLKECAEFYGVTLSTDDEIIAYAWELFLDEKSGDIARNHNYPGFNIFTKWAAGLALGNLFCYYYNRSAVEDLGAILEESESEKAKYTEQQAEECLSRLIYREMEKAHKKVSRI